MISMSDLLHELVPRMPPLSMAVIEDLADKVRAELKIGDGPIDFIALIDHVLPDYGIFVYPASDFELKDMLGATIPEDETTTTILIRKDLWHDLYVGGSQANMAKATLMHELSHAVLHVRVLRQRLRHVEAGTTTLNRVRRGDIRAYEDPEWQAWALAGCMLAPRKAVLSVISAGRRTVGGLARHFDVSEGMMRSHLKRLKLLERRER
jgi:Zn-dependent peptidase ImmA (M78 family)